jgi:integrase
MLSLPSIQEVVTPNPTWRWKNQGREYVAKRERESLARRTLLEIRRVIDEAGDELERGGLACSVSRFGDAQLDYLLEVAWRPTTETQTGLASATRKYYINFLNGFLKANGNLTIERRRLSFPRHPVRRLVALSENEARRLLDAAETRGILAHSIVALELLMGLRRSEVLRLRLPWLGESSLEVHGKGRGGSKQRWIPWHDEVRRILPELLVYRQQAITGHVGPDPGFLFAHKAGDDTLRVWSKAWVDLRIMAPVFEAAGIVAPGNLNHALRRTFGKTLWRNGVPIEKVAELMGHEDTKTTRRYLVLDQDDMRDAMAVLNRVLPARRA